MIVVTIVFQGTTSLESFVAMNGMKPKDDSHLGPAESQKIKRGRPRKDDYEMKLEITGVKGEYRTGNDGMIQNLTSSSGAQVRVLVTYLLKFRKYRENFILLFHQNLTINKQRLQNDATRSMEIHNNPVTIIFNIKIQINIQIKLIFRYY